MEIIWSYLISRDLLWWLDKISGTIEYCILYPFFVDVRHIAKVKTSISINLKSQFMWFTYCVWCVIYFACLKQYFAMVSSVVWCLCYFAKFYVVIKYRPNGSVEI